ncbi:uncharacterized membrane protein YsdA (DUF1294 family) [Cytobacillus oceanisediminis]|uniref:Uncharacterized membrane protein YsdA (DUF1294 family) n=1 Tax=Cytobacillus oceanisediminis TaxID=665099 RepID=A0A2V2ZP16_9BACI|nr:DUF1294 domain-containing protein [Cytobacillus oceanisediminis]PWW26071.1 uncharacterized membrane protein YsdA (DUF1294 family) [Cytobacillus oceanisediminis]
MFKTIVIVYLIVNIAGFFLMKVDKEKAKRNQYRISEKTLWLVAFLSGAAGMTLGMNTFRHKTKHLQFKFGLPALALLEAGLIVYIIIQLS